MTRAFVLKLLSLVLIATAMVLPCTVGASSAALSKSAAPDLNLALGRPAKASAVGIAGQEADKAVDGSTSTKWASNLSEVSWLTVDLGKHSKINRYRLIHANPYERWQRQSINLRDFQFQVSNDQKKWVTVDSMTNNTADVTDHSINVNKEYRYVRVYITNPQTEPTFRGGRIFELEVYGSQKGLRNLALNKPAKASAVGIAGQEADKAVDSLTSTKWASNLSEISWLTVDLGKRSKINRYRLIHANPYERWQRQSINLRDFQFQVSNDQKKWVTVDSVTNNTADVTDHIIAVDGKYRYVRVYITNPQTEPTFRGGRIFELEVY